MHNGSGKQLRSTRLNKIPQVFVEGATANHPAESHPGKNAPHTGTQSGVVRGYDVHRLRDLRSEFGKYEEGG
jgi:hypothetical protein